MGAGLLSKVCIFKSLLAISYQGDFSRKRFTLGSMKTVGLTLGRQGASSLARERWELSAKQREPPPVCAEGFNVSKKEELNAEGCKSMFTNGKEMGRAATAIA